MKIWFVRHNNESLGPYTIEELKNLSVTKEDYVWKEGLTDWVQAKSLAELNTLFTATSPPPYIAQNHINTGSTSFDNQSAEYHSYLQTGNKRNKSRSRLMWISIILILSFVTYLIYANKQSPYASAFNIGAQKSPEQIRAELAQSERQSPGQFISGRTGHRRNLIGETVIEGTLNNSATIAVFKDVVLRVDFLSKTNTIITSKDFTIYEIIRPGQTINFKQKAYVGKDVQNVSVAIMGATAME